MTYKDFNHLMNYMTVNEAKTIFIILLAIFIIVGLLNYFFIYRKEEVPFWKFPNIDIILIKRLIGPAITEYAQKKGVAAYYYASCHSSEKLMPIRKTSIDGEDKFVIDVTIEDGVCPIFLLTRHCVYMINVISTPGTLSFIDNDFSFDTSHFHNDKEKLDIQNHIKELFPYEFTSLNLIRGPIKTMFSKSLYPALEAYTYDQLANKQVAYITIVTNRVVVPDETMAKIKEMNSERPFMHIITSKEKNAYDGDYFEPCLNDLRAKIDEIDAYYQQNGIEFDQNTLIDIINRASLSPQNVPGYQYSYAGKEDVDKMLKQKELEKAAKIQKDVNYFYEKEAREREKADPRYKFYGRPEEEFKKEKKEREERARHKQVQEKKRAMKNRWR